MSTITPMRWRQTWSVFRLEIGKTLFSRRGLWVYVLALLPLVPFVMMGINFAQRDHQRTAWAAAQMADPGAQLPAAAAIRSLPTGLSEAAVRQRLGTPGEVHDFVFRNPGPRRTVREDPGRNLYYATADGSFDVVLKNGAVRNVVRLSTPGTADLIANFAVVFQFFMLHLAIFFGCLGIFMNLFRGELLDQSLHFYFLTPIRREVVLAGKFCAGLAAAWLIFGVSVGLQMVALGRIIPAPARAQFLSVQHGWAQLGAYFGITLLACLAYGAVFCAAGLLTKNPILPAVILLAWEGINPFLPALLKKISIIYYLGALLPNRINLPPGTPSLFQLLISDPDALAPVWAVCGLLVVAALLLAWSARRVRHLELDYTAE